MKPPPRFLLALGLALATSSCATRPPASAAAAAAPAHARRAVLISIDGMSGLRLEGLLARPGALPAGGLKDLVDTGFFAVRSVPSTPSLTPAAHATHVTGALPRDTGIVGNSLMDRSRPFGTKRTGFETPLRADTLCEAAHRQGRRVGVMAYPHAAGTPPSGCADFGMNWVSDPISRARIAKLPATAWTASLPPPGGGEAGFSPVQRAVIIFPPTAHRVLLAAVDSTNDGAVNYDRLRVEAEVGPPASVAPGEWFAAEVSGRQGRAGAWCKLLSLAPDLSSVEIYVGGISETDAYPAPFRRDVDARAGFWPGRADYTIFGPDSGRAEIYQEQSRRLTDFLAAAALVAEERTDWDLLFLYFSEVDAIEHHFLLVDPRQVGFSEQRAALFGRWIDQSYAEADAAIARLKRALTPRDAVFVTADHGMTPLWTEIYPDEILREAGLVTRAADGSIDPSSSVAVMATSGIAHVYVHPAAPAGTLDEAARRLSELRIRGEDPWDRIVRREHAGALALDAPESGDLILLARPGYHLSMKMVPGQTSGVSEEYGGHGYRAAYPELDATFLAAGPGVARGRVPQILSTTIAARIAAALGIEPPRQAQRGQAAKAE
ncbi:MAG: alkaline phosphatase family protein [Acidobacteria bacterium]|nr:alkaline phosphatase family protein [Acidobacteriota bacterium]